MDDLARYEQSVEDGGGARRQARIRRLGGLTARERVAALVDDGTFVEWRRYATGGSPDVPTPPGDGVVAGFARVKGRRIGVIAHDPTVRRGDLGVTGASRITAVLTRCEADGLPVVTLAESLGARVSEGVDAVAANGAMMHAATRLQDKVPHLTLVCGPTAGAAAYTATLGDFVAMIDERSFLFITGPTVTRVAVGEDVGMERLGGAKMHAEVTGVCHGRVADPVQGIAWLHTMLDILEPVRTSTDPVGRPVPELTELIPECPRYGYDMRRVLDAVFDRGSVVELSPDWARNLLTGFARLGGRAVAIVASQPMHLAGTLDIDASRKASAFIRKASAWGLPILTFVDVPGYLPGEAQERGGILPFGAELLTAYARADVPRIGLVVRKSYGGGNVLSYASDVRLALPTGRVGAMGPDAAVALELGPEPKDATDAERAERAERADAWRARWDTVQRAAESGYLDQIVRPEDTRTALYRALDSFYAA